MEILDVFWNALVALAQKSGFCNITLQQGFMIAVSFLLMYLAIVRKFEPLLLLPIAFGMMLTNIPGANMFHPEMFGISPDPAIAANFAETVSTTARCFITAVCSIYCISALSFRYSLR